MQVASLRGLVFDTRVRLRRKFIFVTGTDTGVGKTVFTTLLIESLRRAGVLAAGLKPLCSGRRDDARMLQSAQQNDLTLDEINPWWFRAAIAPMLAARRAGRRVTLREVVGHARRIQSRFPVVAIEGAGGLLSPMGENFDSRDLITALRAVPMVVGLNRLGAINQVLLVFAALPKAVASRAQVILFTPSKRDPSGPGNLEVLRERMGDNRVHELPWMENPTNAAGALADRGIGRVMNEIQLAAWRS